MPTLTEGNMYYFAKNNGLEGWSLEECESLEELKDKIKTETYGLQFKLFKEMDFKIIDEER
ncbi:MAG: hypothetical protein GY870_22000 [archaeon]|nr:hypothetical protein [archaeon]